MISIVFATLPGVENELRMNFSTKSQPEISPTKVLTYPGYFFWQRGEKIWKIYIYFKKDRALGTRLPTKVDILKI